MAGFCTSPDCLNPEHASGLCVGHFRRKARGRPVGRPLREVLTPWGRVMEASITLAEVSTDDDGAFRRAEDNLRTAIRAWARADVLVPSGEPVPERV